ncbi:MAG: protein translocase subunit SecD [bacterium]|nr:protein translocase subunit SecD [bacterium]
MKIFRYAFITFIALTILWIDLPRAIPINVGLFGKRIKTEIPVLELHFTIGDNQVVKNFNTRLGLDLSGGSHLVFQTDTSQIDESDLEDALQSTRDIIEQRVNLFGISEPEVRTIKSGNVHRISVDLPGVYDVAQASQLIGQTAQLHFQEESDEVPNESSPSAVFSRLTKETGLTGKDVERARVDFNTNDGTPQVALEFTPVGAKMFAEITKRNVGKPVGIFLDEFLISAPTVQQEIIGGNAVISGSFTTEGAKQLAIAINSGALPVPIELVEQRSIGPSLGAEEVKKSLVGGVIGLGMVIIFMIGYYGRLGLIASGALIAYGLINFAIFRAIPIVLTLPGVAGFILSIGMAVDSNILIFERIKEEQRKGKSLEVSIRLGFGRAIDAIKDANLTTLLVAFILFNPLNWEFLPQFGLVRGFALTLGIGVATSLFTGVVITKWLIKVFYKQ